MSAKVVFGFIIVGLAVLGCNSKSERKMSNGGSNTNAVVVTNDTPSNSNTQSDNAWLWGKWQVTMSELGLTTLNVNSDNTVIYFAANTPRFRGTYFIEDDVMYCFFETENIQFPFNKSTQTIDFGEGYYARKVSN